MKTIAASLAFFVLALALFAGCTGQNPATHTTMTTPAMTTTPVVTATTPMVPANLAQSWRLSLMAINNGGAIIKPVGSVTITFWPTGALSGYSGCNNYNAPFTLSGEVTAKGNAITVGPIATTTMYCEAVADQETTYYAIIQKAAAYTINGDKLTITASDGTSLSYTIVKP